MELGRYFSANVINEYLAALRLFAEKLKEVIGEIELPQVSWGTSLAEMKNVFNEIEEAIYSLDGYVPEVLGWENPYSVDTPFVFERKNGSLYPYIKRWYNWLNYNNEEYNKRFGNYEYLYTIENGVEEQAFDINNEPIQVKKEVA